MIPHFELPYIFIAGKLIPITLLALTIATIVNFIVALLETRRIKLSYLIIVITILIQYIIGGFLARSLFYLSQTLLHQSMDLSQILRSKIEIVSLFIPLNFTSIPLLLTGDPPYPLLREIMGLVYFGTFLSFVPAVFLNTYIIGKRKDFLKYLDIILIAQVASLIVFRIGNILRHLHVGKVTTMPWGVKFGGEIRHETAFYSVFSFLILSVFIWKTRGKIKTPGVMSFIIMAWISSSIFIIDFFKKSDGNMNYRFWDIITANQIAYFFAFILCVFAIKFLYKKHSKLNEKKN